VLALAEGSVRLLEVTPDLPTFEVSVPDLPSDAADAVGKSSITDRSPARRLQGTEGRKTLVRSYARAIDRVLRARLDPVALEGLFHAGRLIPIPPGELS
jgi:hypothetical protein